MKKSTLCIASAAALAVVLAACTEQSPPRPPIPRRRRPTTSAPVRQSLQTEVYNPGASGIFQVASTLVIGANDAVLVDAQFSTVDALKLVERINASGKRLTTIYISHGDPDYYFGLIAPTTAFPSAKVLATPQTVAHIRETSAAKLQFWGPKLGAGAPASIVIPEPLQGNRIDLKATHSRSSASTAPRPIAPSCGSRRRGRCSAAFRSLPANTWMADAQTPQSHVDWIATLDRIASLDPQTVIPGHFKPGAPQNLDAVGLSPATTSTRSTKKRPRPPTPRILSPRCKSATPAWTASPRSN